MKYVALALLMGVPALAPAALTVTADTTSAPRFVVANAQVACNIDFDDRGHLVRETLYGLPDWLATSAPGTCAWRWTAASPGK